MYSNCIICNKDFKSRSHGKKGKKKFCSRTCFHKSGINWINRYNSPQERFFKSISNNNINNCWEWNGAISLSGYGILNVNKKLISSHRYSYLLHFGEIPNKLFVCHKCDNRKCVNPEHLFLGTNHDNVKDMIKKGRKNPVCGENSPKSKLKNQEVIEIKKLIKKNISLSEIAKKFNIGKRQISYIKNNQAWKHIKID